MAGPMDSVKKLRNILHPGVKHDGQVYHEGALDTKPPGQPTTSPYGLAEGVDTRANQFEHDMKIELGQAGPKAETRRGIGTDWTAAPGGIGEGMDTRTNEFERELREDMDRGYVVEGRRGSTAAWEQEGRRLSAAGLQGSGHNSAGHSRKSSGAEKSGSGRKGSILGNWAGFGSRKGSASEQGGRRGSDYVEGKTEGVDTTSKAFEKDVTGEMAKGHVPKEVYAGGVGEGVDTRTNKFEKQVADEMGANHGITPAPANGTSSTAGVGTTSTTTTTASTAAHATEGHSDTAREVHDGPHSSRIANILDPAVTK